MKHMNTLIKWVDFKSYFDTLKPSRVQHFEGDIFAHWNIIPLKYINTLGCNLVVLNTNADNQKQLPDVNNILEYVWHNENTMLRKMKYQVRITLKHLRLQNIRKRSYRLQLFSYFIARHNTYKT